VNVAKQRQKLRAVLSRNGATVRELVEYLGRRGFYTPRKVCKPYLVTLAIPAGSFLMGSPDRDPNAGDHEKPQHEVSLPAFYLSKYPITQQQWQSVMGNNPSHFSGNPKHPVENVTWHDCQSFCQKLSQLTGKTYRLPTEAEWEYACRAGTTTRYSFGDDSSQLGNYAWYDSNSGNKTHPVGQKKPNAWGLHDMHGNVWEWCADDWHESYAQKPQALKNNGSVVWSNSNASSKLLRGGSWLNAPRYCRSAFRLSYYPDIRGYSYGFRVVCVHPSP
jgi:formylglycine-generating enzyme required for sulfatase activity